MFSNTNFNYTRPCNSECGCEAAKLFPVCDLSGKAFYSPCHAGCRHVNVVDLSSYQLVGPLLSIFKSCNDYFRSSQNVSVQLEVL